MTDYCVHQQNIHGPATHVLIIGVGAYDHLPGGTGNVSQFGDGMKQLSSPPVSARAFANEIIRQSDSFTAKKLGSVRVLTSESNPAQFTNSKTGTQVALEPATLANVKEAWQHWKNDGDSNENNLLLFYFCGHGISAGADFALLLSDYGKDDDNFLENAVDLRMLMLGMERCKASQQIYFIDACRASTDTLFSNAGSVGSVLIQQITNARTGLPDIENPVFYATLKGEEAFGRKKEISQFTSALISGLKGAGSDDYNGTWAITTTYLKAAIDRFMDFAVRRGHNKAQVPPTSNLTTFNILELPGEPLIPVFVYCDPDSASTQAEFSCRSNNGFADHGRASPNEWSLELTPDKYFFSAHFDGGVFNDVTDKERKIRPPMREISLEVGP